MFKQILHRNYVFLLLLCSIFFPRFAWAMPSVTGGGQGTEASPYTINSKDDFKQFADYIREAGNTTYKDKYWKLTANITYRVEHVAGQSYSTGVGNPISFQGTFDGGNYTISIEGDISSVSYDNVGLFNQTQNATIKNLKVSAATLNGRNYSGTLIGHAFDNLTLENVHVTQKATSFHGWHVGGLVGIIERATGSDAKTLSINNCSYINAETLFLTHDATNLYAGGFVGRICAYYNATFTDCQVFINKIFFGSNGQQTEYTTSGPFGFFIGQTESNTTMIRCTQGTNSFTANADRNRAHIVGRLLNNTNVSGFACYSASSYPLSGNGGNGLIGGFITDSKDWSNFYYDEYTRLERKSDDGLTIAANKRGAERWGIEAIGYSTNRPQLNATNYAIKLTRGEGINAISGTGYSIGSDYYRAANTNYTINPSFSMPLTTHQRIVYAFSPAYNHSAFNETTNPNYTLKSDMLNSKVDGTASAKLENIPYPIELKAVFDQWKKKITLSYKYDNPQDLAGKFYVYRRASGGTTWTKDSGTTVTKTANANTYNIVNTEIALATGTTDLEKTWEFQVVFIEGSAAAPNSPDDQIHKASVTQNTITKIDLSTFKVTSGKNSIGISFTVSEYLTSSSEYSYTIQRRKNTGDFAGWSENKLFEGKATAYTFTDDGIASSCDEYAYRLIVSAFSKTFTSDTVTGRVTGSTEFDDAQPFKASKGEYANYVRLQWKAKRLVEGSTETFRIFRRIANTANAYDELEIVTGTSPTVYWNDMNALTGVYYEYKVVLYQICSGNEKIADERTSIGFTQAFGTVSGRVTYGTGGTAVQGVDMLVKRQDLQDGSKQYHSLASPGGGEKFEWADSAKFNPVWTSRKWTLQFWVNPNTIADNGTIGYIGNTAINLAKTADGYQVYWGTGSRSEIIPANHFSHIVITRDEDAMKIYTVCDQNRDSIYIKNISYDNTTEAKELSPANALISFGHTLKGNIDEIRFWSRVLTEAEIRRDYNRLIIGNESGLTGYWTLDEGLAHYAFDKSRVGTVYNGNHATTNTLASDTLVPSEIYQLALKGITDADGNYQIGGIPYSGEGTSYSIVPSFGIHQFNPTQRLRYISPSSMVHNGTDFDDVSSFPVSGKVYYQNSNYPVEGAQISIDGIVANKDGKMIETNSEGAFTVDVPIGAHFITISKQGHTFAGGGRFPANEWVKHNFQTSINNLEFFDLTTVRLAGRVVGGDLQTKLPLGFGLSKANIGQAVITLQTVNDKYRLNLFGDSTVVNVADSASQAGQERTSTTIFKESSSGSVIKIETNPETGEFLAVLPPVPYQITGMKTKEFEDTFTDGNAMDFNYSKYMFDINPNVPATLEYAGKKFPVHDSLKITRYNDPVLEVRDLKNKYGAFGDSIYIHIDRLTGKKDTIRLYTVENDLVNYKLGVPVLNQNTNKYYWEVKAYERYVNRDGAEEIEDIIPMKGQTIDISNALASERVDFTYSDPATETVDWDNPVLTESNTTLVLDSTGVRTYTFNTGFPNIAGDNRLKASLSLPFNGKTYKWEQEGILFGQLPSAGSNFVTMGPDMVDIVLHDPPGSNSYAYIAKGSSYTKTYSHTDIATATESVELIFHFGVQNKTATGMAFMVINEIENKGDLITNIEFEEVYTDNNDYTNSVTFSEQISTSGDPNYIGSMADIYIGQSTNLVYGMVRKLALYPSIEIPEGVTPSWGNKQTDYSLFTQEKLTAGAQFGTTFSYTQTHLLEHQIPSIKELRNQLIIPVSVSKEAFDPDTITFDEGEMIKYVSFLPANNPKFGEEGNYSVYYNPKNDPTALVENKVSTYNNWVVAWEKRIADNEQAKLDLYAKRDDLDKTKDAKIFQNVSYDAGVSLEKSTEVTYQHVYTQSFSWSGGVVASGRMGFTWNGFGLEVNPSVGAKGEQNYTDIDDRSNTITFGYVLAEDESVLFAGKDALSVDVYGPSSDKMQQLMQGEAIPNLSGYTFRTRAGQTSCPWEPADSTLFVKDEYENKYLLNYGTFKIENPELYIDNQKHATAENIASGREATFTLQLQNRSEAKMDVTYQVFVDPASNPKGLSISMDGLPLVEPRKILVKFGEELTKQIKVKQTSQDILDYDHIVLGLGSVCETDNYSEATFSVKFIPSSSPVTLRSDTKLANIDGMKKGTENVGEINFTISEYERNFKNFGCIRLQYRRATEENWTTLRTFVNNESLYPVDSEDKELITGATLSYKYTYTENTPSDGEYIFRAVSVSKIGTDEALFTGDEIRVVKDTKAPQLLGNPSPANGILSAGGEISLTFNEDIQSGKITDDKFTITGILNADLRSEPVAGLSFDGAGSHAQTELPIYVNGSFSIETWMKRPQATAGTVFAFGEGDNYLSLGFDATNHAVVKIGSETYTSPGTVSVDEVWKYVGLSYDRGENTVLVYVLEGTSSRDLMTNTLSNGVQPATQGKLIVGNNAAGTSGFSGAIALTEFYNTARSLADATVSKNTVKSGKEPNLIGLWEMEEGEGSVAKDKARARNLLLSTSWYIYPSGRSLAFNGTSDYATLPSETFPFISTDDFTWELWFKAPAQDAATLLSIGSMATVGFNAAHELVLASDGKTQTLNKPSLLDDRWHHFALSVKRSGQAKALIDGKVTATFTSNNMFPVSVGGGYYYLGAKYTQPNTYSEYFKGNIDEVRVWNLALATDHIVLNKNSKLRGDEAGLKAYYPFESYQKRDQLIDVYESLNDAVAGSTSSVDVDSMTAAAASTIAVPVKDARPVKNVPFTFTASERKIALNLTEEAYRLEDVTLTITAKDIPDMHNNVSAPVLWLAYIRQNTLLWDSDPVNIVMQQGEKKTFTARITNSGATTVSYTIGNIPTWLSVNSAAGNLQPLASKELTFTVSNNMNIGNYEMAVELTSGNGINELLPVQLKVTGARPDWTVNSSDFEQSMTATGQLFIEGAPQEDEEDLLAAFIGDVCVGLASPQYESAYNAAFVYMTLWGNSADVNKEVTFKLWDASTGNIYPVVETSIGSNPLKIKFNDGAIEGTPDAPILFNALEILEQSIAMGKGWNWISFNVNDYTVSLIDQFKTNAAGFASQIKAGNGNTLTNANSWGGNLLNITSREAYLVKSNGAAALKMLGKAVKSAETPITLAAGKWSWIGYTPQFTATVAEALAGISNPQPSDQIKGQKGYRMMSANGWIGNLSSMEPGRGYKYKSNNAQAVQFNYPALPSSLRSASLRSSQDIIPVYEADMYLYSGTMTVTASLWFGNTEVSEGQYEIAAFSGNECRGSALLESIDGFEHGFMAFLMIYGEGSEDIRFLIVDHETGMEYEANEHINFSSDAILGIPDDLYRISSSVTGISRIGDNVRLYPNPVETLLYIRYNSEKLDRISITDVSGRIIWLRENFIDGSINVSSLSTGVYLLKVQDEGLTSIYKFIKK